MRLSQVVIGLALGFLVVTPAAVRSQAPAVPQADRVTTQVQPGLRAAFVRQLPAAIQTDVETGSLTGAVPVEHLVYMVSRSPDVEAALDKLVQAQQDPSSTQYHQWLTPQQVGELYGPTQHDIDAVTQWLGDSGLKVESISASRTAITFSGTADQVNAAFATSLHTFQSGETHQSYVAAMTMPTVPAALAPVTQTVIGLLNHSLRAYGVHRSATPEGGTAQPDSTFYGGNMVNTDFNGNYGITPIISAGYTGKSQRIAVIIDSLVHDSNIQQNGVAIPTILVPSTVGTPTYSNDEFEATLDVVRAGGTATGAGVDLIAGPDLTVNTVTNLLQYAITLNDPVISMSFGGCEASAGQSLTTAFDGMFKTAAAQGIAVYVSSGDSGAAGCDAHDTPAPATQIASPNYLCSSQYVTCVGGTDFPNGYNSTYAVKESAWNEPGTTSFAPDASGGGVSAYIAKPTWQTGTGVPNDGGRDTPDISFHAALHDGYVICAATLGYPCGGSTYAIAGGTSASAPSMAGISALLNDYTGKKLGI